MFHLRIHSEASKVSGGRSGRREWLKWEDSSGWAGCISGCEGYLRVG